ncbi:hypothetical protein [Candidatus Phytoplasma prunorum]
MVLVGVIIYQRTTIITPTEKTPEINLKKINSEIINQSKNEFLFDG